MKKWKVIYVTLSQGEEQAYKMCFDDFEVEEPDKKFGKYFFDGSEEWEWKVSTVIVFR